MPLSPTAWLDNSPVNGVVPWIVVLVALAYGAVSLEQLRTGRYRGFRKLRSTPTAERVRAGAWVGISVALLAVLVGLSWLTSSAVVALLVAGSYVALAFGAAWAIRRKFTEYPGATGLPPPQTPREFLRAYRTGSILIPSFTFGSLAVLLVVVGSLPAWYLIIYGAMLTISFVTEVVRLRTSRRLVRLNKTDIISLAVGVALLLSAGLWTVVRPDNLGGAPGDAHPVPACPASVVVPDQGNEINRSLAGDTTQMTVGGKIYITDSPTGREALQALSVEGPQVICAAGLSPGLGEAAVAVAPGNATLYVRPTNGATYRLTVAVRT